MGGLGMSCDGRGCVNYPNMSNKELDLTSSNTTGKDSRPEKYLSGYKIKSSDTPNSLTEEERLPRKHSVRNGV